MDVDPIRPSPVMLADERTLSKCLGRNHLAAEASGVGNWPEASAIAVNKP
jgi:hypothetical protein